MIEKDDLSVGFQAGQDYLQVILGIGIEGGHNHLIVLGLGQGGCGGRDSIG